MKIRGGKRQEARGKRRKSKVESRKSKVGIYLLLLLLLFSIQGCQSRAKPQGLEVRVSRVVSGQTLKVTGTGEQASQVRLVGIDAPDLQQQPWGTAAKERLQARIGSKPVLLEFDIQNKDSFGRQLAYVWQDGVLLNEQLVKEGYVLFVPRSPNQKYDQLLERAQESARLMGVGIWNPSQPMRSTPAEFRKSRG